MANSPGGTGDLRQQALERRCDRHRQSMLEISKHYGNLRFAMSTFFTAVSAGLITAATSERAEEYVRGSLLILLKFFGMFMAALFVMAHARMSCLVTTFHARAGLNLNGSGTWTCFAFATMAVPQLGMFLFWAIWKNGVLAGRACAGIWIFFGLISLWTTGVSILQLRQAVGPLAFQWSWLFLWAGFRWPSGGVDGASPPSDQGSSGGPAPEE